MPFFKYELHLKIKICSGSYGLVSARRDIVEKGSDNHFGKSQTTFGLIWDTERQILI